MRLRDLIGGFMGGFMGGFIGRLGYELCLSVSAQIGVTTHKFCVQIALRHILHKLTHGPK